MSTVKRTFPYVLSIIISSLCLIAMLFAYIVQSQFEIGYNGYEMMNVTQLGFWSVVLCIASFLFVVSLILVVVISFLEIFNDCKVVKFEIIFRKLNSFILVKFLLLLMLVFAFLEMLFTIFLVVANNDIGLALGAGVFILFAVMLIGYILFLFLERANYFETWAKLPKNKKEIEIKNREIKNNEEDNDVIIEE